MRPTAVPGYSVVFVCQAGELEIKACLLAASLRAFLDRHVKIVAAVPVPAERWGQIRQSTLSFLASLRVEVRYVANEVDESYGYANKVSALGVAAKAPIAIFLDSDILCLRNLDASQFAAPFCAKPADFVTWGAAPGMWETPYALFGLDVPSRNVSATISGQTSLPYFNAGVIAVEDPVSFSECWAECCQRIDREPRIADKRPHLDQIALPVAAARLGLDFQTLGEAHNFPAHLRPLTDDIPVFCHYHWPAIIRREPQLLELVNNLVSRHPNLALLLEHGGGEWESVLQALRMQPNFNDRWRFRRYLWRAPRQPKQTQKLPELIISGIPRSGTSLLCRLLHDQPDCVVINEPAEIFAPLTHCENPWSLACHYRNLRRDILAGEKIENKISDGRVVTDTRVSDVRLAYRPAVSRPDFLLGIKNTLAFLARISIIRTTMPQAPMIVCVRHPLDTIASWKGSFQHLREAQVHEYPLASTRNLFMTGLENRRIERILQTECLAVKRALTWSHLAEIILSHRDRLLIVRYEDLVADPSRELHRIFDAIPGFETPKLRLDPLDLRNRRMLLDQNDRDAIAELCARQAEAFGYSSDCLCNGN